jgi:uncharacterized protein
MFGGLSVKKIINFCVFHPYWVISLVSVITVFFGLQLPSLKIDPRVEIILQANNPVEKDYSANKKEFASYADILIGMLHTNIFDPASLRKIEAISEEVKSIKGVRKVTSILDVKNIHGTQSGLEVTPMLTDNKIPSTAQETKEFQKKATSWDVYNNLFVTKDGKGTAILIVLDGNVQTDDIIPIYYKLQDIMKKYEGPEKFFISGTKVLEALQGHYMLKDLKLLPPLVCIVLVGFLFLFFRDLRGVFIPLLTVGIAAVWALGVMSMMDIPMTIVSAALPVVMMAVGIAYGVHVVENVFSDNAQGRKGKRGIKGAVYRITIPVIMAGLTTIASFLSLCTTVIRPLTHFGLLSAFAIALAMGLALTFIPAVLSVLDSLGMVYIPHHHTKRDLVGPLLKRLSFINIHKKGWIFTICLIIFIISVILGSHVRSDLNLVEDFRKRSPIRIADEILNKKFGGTSQFNVAFQTKNPDDIKEPTVLKEMEDLENQLKGLPGIGKAVSIVDFIKQMNKAMHDGDPAYYVIPDSKELVAQYLLLYSFSGGGDELESFVNYDFSSGQILLQMKTQSGYLARDVAGKVDAFENNKSDDSKVTKIITTGIAMLAKEFNRVIVTSQIQSFILAFTLCFFITTGIFRSFKLGVYSMVPLLIPITLDFGIMGSTGIKLNAATATVASIDIGMGIDYCIHFLSRYRHEIRLGHTVDEAIDIALNTAGRGIIYNALAVSAGFMVLIPSQFVIISQLGLLVAIDMITIATSALTFLPACIKLLPPKLVYTGKTVHALEVPMAVPAQGAMRETMKPVKFADGTIVNLEYTDEKA